MARTVLVTGAAGFIGAALSQRLLQGDRVVGLDNLNDYYDVKPRKRDCFKSEPLPQGGLRRSASLSKTAKP